MFFLSILSPLFPKGIHSTVMGGCGCPLPPPTQASRHISGDRHAVRPADRHAIHVIKTPTIHIILAEIQVVVANALSSTISSLSSLILSPPECGFFSI
jgi:hypothetical protein